MARVSGTRMSEGGALAQLAPHLDGAAERANLGHRHIHADPAAGDTAHRLRRAEAGPGEHPEEQVVARGPRHQPPPRPRAAPSPGSSPGRSRVHRRSGAARPSSGRGWPRAGSGPPSGLPAAHPLLRRLDPVIGRVPHQVQQRLGRSHRESSGRARSRRPRHRSGSACRDRARGPGPPGGTAPAPPPPASCARQSPPPASPTPAGRSDRSPRRGPDRGPGRRARRDDSWRPPARPPASSARRAGRDPRESVGPGAADWASASSAS